MKINPGTQPENAGKKPNPIQKWIIIVSSILGLLIVIGLIIFPRLKTERTATPEGYRTSAPTNPAPMDAAPALGPKNAPVTIIEYGDFGCPSCWAWYKQGVLDQLRLKYGDQIHFIWRDYPVITLLSPKAAEAGQCANEQGKFWEFHDAVYGNNGVIEASNLRAYAAAIGLNMSQFDECTSSRRYKDRVNAEETEAFTHGYNGAPFFLINGQLLIGGQSLSSFSAIIDPILASRK